MCSDDKILIDIAYLDSGLVPDEPQAYRHDGTYSLADVLGKMPEIDARRTKRRFRKLLRRAVKWHECNLRARMMDNPGRISNARRRAHIKRVIKNLRSSVGFDLQANLRPTQRHMAMRRSLVRDYMRHMIRDNHSKD